jgi:hypothetical protein
MKISVFGLFLRIIVIGLIIFSVYGLLIQFVFSFFNQSINGPSLTILNFAAPFLITIFILFLAALKIFLKNALTRKKPFSSIIRAILTILLLALTAWQAWYIVTLFKMKMDLEWSRKLTEVIPMTVGLLTTLLFVTKTIKQKHDSLQNKAVL